MDLSQRALQINGKLLFFQISSPFSNKWLKTKNIQTNSKV